VTVAKASPAAAAAENKHQQRTAATRRALLKAARRIFAREGFESCRIEDIAAATGHTRGAFYAHFQSKEDVFFALLEQEAGARYKEVRAMLEQQPTPEGRRAAMRDYFVTRASDRQWTMLMLEFKLFALRRPKLRAKLAAQHRRIRLSLKLQFLDDLISHGEDASEGRKAALEAMLHGLILENAYDPERLPRAAITALLGGLFDLLIQ
jgi:AcrR family transcriptional regulator